MKTGATPGPRGWENTSTSGEHGLSPPRSPASTLAEISALALAQIADMFSITSESSGEQMSLRCLQGPQVPKSSLRAQAFWIFLSQILSQVFISQTGVLPGFQDDHPTVLGKVGIQPEKRKASPWNLLSSEACKAQQK